MQDLPIRLSPNDDATVRAFLNQGEHVAIRQEVRSNGQTWLLIRTGTGTGWVRAGDVLH
ncbi:MAG: SH3 domain-containing protein [Rhodospirillales bacterium]